MNLTDNDKREIIQLIQENKSLPDKYRFLLFKGREEIELLWNGKSNEVTRVTLPFQIIEHIDEPREEKEISLQGNLFDESGRQISGWTNKLIWGNNNLILSSILNGPIYNEIKNEGGLKLIYIDPPFNVGDDFNFEIKVGDEEFTKKRNFLEEIAYRDTWGKGSDSFLSMFYERLLLMKMLLAENGSIFVHCDWRLNNYIKSILIDVFGENNFRNEIIWYYPDKFPTGSKVLMRNHDTILHFSKSNDFISNPVYEKKENPNKRAMRRWDPILKKSVDIVDEKGKKQYVTYDEKKIDDVWRLPRTLKNNYYPTQKPETLAERIIKIASNKDDLIADFFCGSGTTLVAAENLGRKWIGSDLGKFAIHTSRKRLIEVQRQKKKDSNNFRAFEILNLGKFQRENFISKENIENNKDKEEYYIDFILNAYNAEKINNQILHGIKNNRYVFIGPINLHVSRKSVEAAVNECVKNKITKVDILCFEHEQGLFPNIINEAKDKGVDVSCKIIPPDVFDKKAIEKKQIVFHDVAYIEFKPIYKKNHLHIELTGFSVDYSQEKLDEALSELKQNRSKVILVNGQIIKISKDKNNIEKKEVLTKSWEDWIDYWAVDFDFENKKEFFKRKNENGEIEEVWSGDYIFENEWQSFRSKEKKLELISAKKEVKKTSVKVAVKVIDIFGNDTMKVIKVNL